MMFLRCYGGIMSVGWSMEWFILEMEWFLQGNDQIFRYTWRGKLYLNSELWENIIFLQSSRLNKNINLIKEI
jgi:hypothetical protein